ncbi:MAG: PEP/pyruvate-binding domain-containing protein [Bacteroidota bacterium]|jgi:CheY-like chemotaxis protein
MNRFDRFSTEDIYGSRIKSFQKLMHIKVRDILLVASLYDQYLFEEDGRLYELIRQEFQVLNLSHPPEITHVTSGEEAIELLTSGEKFDLVITTMHIEDMHVIRFAQKVRQTGIDIPMILLAYDNREKKEIILNYDTSVFDRIFIWTGDYRLLVAMIKYVEDRLNVQSDTATVGVQVIILVEDDISFYSSYLPLLYTQILNQSQRLISEGVNLTHKFLRMRARPKILLCSTYEEAWSYFEKYEDFVLGVISDIDFLREGVKDPEAGFKFAKAVRQRREDIPILLQSGDVKAATKAFEIGAAFLQKGSPTLLHDLNNFVMTHFGFGDFIFRMPDGTEVGRATNLKQLEEHLQTVPDECIQYHAKRNHFSNWLKARTEFWLAHKLRPQKVEDFPSATELRNDLIGALRLYLETRQLGIITEFSKESFDPQNSFARIGTGSVGGKARGLGFINTLINNYNIRDRFEGVEISVPSAVVIATDVFDRFLLENKLENFILESKSDEEVLQRFTDAPYFPPDVVFRLIDFLEIMHEPLAVRSSSLLEDSQYQPFAGVYQTYMLPNKNSDPTVRLHELLESIKLVYASTFSKKAKDYMKATPYRLEEEKMAVIIQRMVGTSHHNRFYPEFAGVAKSYNFYPVPPQKSEDGIVQVALGLGYTVVEGHNSVRFCPKYPRHLMQFFTTKETIRNAQQEYLALDLTATFSHENHETPDVMIKHYDLNTAEEDHTLFYVGSTYSPEDDSVYDGVSRAGKRVVTFAPVLKHRIFPLPEILDLILEMGTWGMGTHVEVEFAVNMNTSPGEPKEFAMLQIRPLVMNLEFEELDVDQFVRENLICQSEQVLGNGAVQDIYDIVMVDSDKFDRSKSKETAREVSEINARLLSEHRPYVLIGMGRWGSMDPWLGIPVTWDQISGASVIVESGFKDIDVTPSQGSHFFQNITSFRVGYFTVNTSHNLGFIDWDWLKVQPAFQEFNHVRHLRFDKPFSAKINGRKNRGVIMKPGK